MDNPRFPPNSSDETEQLIAEVLRLAGPRNEVAPERLARIKAAARSEWTQAVRPAPSFRFGWLLTAAAAAVIVLAVWFRPASNPSPVGERAAALDVVGTVTAAELATVADTLAANPQGLNEGDSLLAGRVLRTGSRGVVGMRLPDEYAIRVDQGTTLHFESSHVIVLASGAVYVDSGPPRANKRSLEIRTPLGIVRNMGTQFEVRLQEDAVRVRVREGTVSFDRDGQRRTTTAGRELTAHAAGTIATAAIDVHGSDWIWIGRAAPPFDVAGKTLGQFLDWVTRESGYRVRFLDPALERSSRPIVLGGSIAGLSPTDALTVVLPTCGLRHRLIDGTVTIERAEDRR
jgi:ferric-dicitrate binding protein FerR (iron transport regulator)